MIDIVVGDETLYIKKKRRESNNEINFFMFFDEKMKELRLYYYFSNEYMAFTLKMKTPLTNEEEDYFALLLLSEDVNIEPDPLIEIALYQAIVNWNVSLRSRGYDYKFRLLQLYFCACTSGPLQKLFKCPGLEHICIACVDESIHGLNSDGRSPREILGVPIKMLQLMNSKHGIKFLHSPCQRSTVKEIYINYRNLFNTSRAFTASQLSYIFECHRHGKSIETHFFRSREEYTAEKID